MIDKVRFLLIVLLIIIARPGNSQVNDNSIFDAVDSLLYKDVILAGEDILTLESKINSKSDEGQLLKRKAILARIEGRYNDALAHNLTSLDIFESVKDSSEVAEIYHNLGFLMRYIKDYDLSISYYDKAIKLREKIKDFTTMAISHREIGVIYRRKKEYIKAQYHYDKASKLFDHEKDKEEILTLQGNYASLYHVQKKYDLAIQINKEALKTIRYMDKPKSMATRYGNISMAYYRMKQYDRANVYIDSALIVASQANLLESNVRYTLQKAKIANKQKKYKAAYKIMRNHEKLTDSLSLLSASTSAEKIIKAYEQRKRFIKDSMQLAISKERLETSLRIEKVERKNTFWIVLAIVLAMMSMLLWLLSRIKMTKLQVQNEKLTADIIKEKLQSTQKENERLVDHSQLQTEFKKSIIEKVDKIGTENIKPEANIRNIKQDLLEQLRIENQSQAVNKSIGDLPSTFDEVLRKKYSSLTKGERKLCFLVRSGLTIKEIANINETSATAVQSMRYRIRKKMNLNRDQELQTFLMDIM